MGNRCQVSTIGIRCTCPEPALGVLHEDGSTASPQPWGLCGTVPAALRQADVLTERLKPQKKPSKFRRTVQLRQYSDRVVNAASKRGKCRRASESRVVGGLGKGSRSREGLCNSSPRLCLAEVQVAIQERICTRPLRVSRDKECECVSAGLQAGELRSTVRERENE